MLPECEGLNLKHGEDTITIRKELRHAAKYWLILWQRIRVYTDIMTM